jgi:hypothetical protein
MALIALMLSAGWLYAQDSGDDSSDSSDSSEGAVASDTSPGDISVTDVSNEASVSNDTLAFDPTDPALTIDHVGLVFSTGPASQFGGDFPTFGFGPEGTTPDTPGSLATPGTAGGPDSPAAVPPGTPGGPGGTPGIPGGPVGGPGEDERINAVIVTGAVTPWGCIRRVAGVRNVYVTGSIIALGQTPLPGELPPGSPQPKWLHFAPDVRLERGERFPPVVPNIIDVRIMYFPVAADPAAVQAAAVLHKTESQTEETGQAETGQEEGKAEN